MASILIIDDDVTFCLMLKTLLEKNHHEVTGVFSPVEAKRIIMDRNFEVVLTDMRMPEISGMELIGLIKKQSHLTQIIMMTGYADIASAIKSIKQGAFDYIPKPLNPDEVLAVIANALRAGQQKSNNSNGTKVFSSADFLDGVSSESRQLKEITGLVAPTSMSVLISGESGTGKEYIARLIHQNSKRSRFPFVAVDCGAVPKELAASEFFGHVKGSFTGAIADKTGQFETANGGTLFLDEIENLSYDIQIQLLRALQEPMIKPVGSSKEITVDVRIISATNEDLSEAMDRGNFRKDLYHRLNEFQLSVPPLRSRKQDIMIFAQHFLNQANSNLDKTVLGFDKSIEPVFMDYYWPGNLRELKNIVQRATLLAKGEYITIREIPPELYEQSFLEGTSGKSNHNNEPDMIKKALEASEYNKSKAARLLNIDRKTLYNKLKYYNIFASDNN